MVSCVRVCVCWGGRGDVSAGKGSWTSDVIPGDAMGRKARLQVHQDHVINKSLEPRQGKVFKVHEVGEAMNKLLTHL